MLNAISNNLNSYSPNLYDKNIQNLNLETTLPLNANLDQTLVKDKSEAVDKILGYGVDKEGYFTSDFNEAAGIPKDFKLNAKEVEKSISLFQKEAPFFKFFSKIDLAQTYANAYNAFFKENKSDDFIVNGDDLIVFASSSMKTFISGESSIYGKLAGLDKNTSGKDIRKIENFMALNPIQDLPNSLPSEGWSINSDFFKISVYVKSSQTYNLGSDITKLAQSLRDEYKDLVNSNISLDEFKEKYLDFKQRHDAFVALYKEAMNGAKINIDKDSNGNLNIKIQKNLDDENKPFSPIQAESKNETYTYDDIAKNFFLSFLENERKKGNDVLELLQNLFRVDKGKVDLKA
ncbi:hypothetical protein CAV_0358 [Campylobacter avium LMG 24591]|uniref:Uncharacterized protein n=1 Tax=Campylobacter avium LMG 24591 TaxID=522484 RepID=A0A222MWL1_9BACT|nr:hypothetical protein [Campylobacter avium]ASQ30026.1 hypothetical protein CAV_0358 [Campylobacter avium LMG 24591]OYD79125.1 hypothetical protein CAV8706_0359 [Campylobacter avium]